MKRIERSPDLIYLSSYEIKQKTMSDDLLEVKKSQLHLELTFYSDDTSTAKFEKVISDIKDYLDRKNTESGRGVNMNKNTELMTQIVNLLSESGLTVKQGCDLLDKTKFQMMHHTKVGCNFENTIKEAVILQQLEQEVKF